MKFSTVLTLILIVFIAVVHSAEEAEQAEAATQPPKKGPLQINLVDSGPIRNRGTFPQSRGVSNEAAILQFADIFRNRLTDMTRSVAGGRPIRIDNQGFTGSGYANLQAQINNVNGASTVSAVLVSPTCQPIRPNSEQQQTNNERLNVLRKVKDALNRSYSSVDFSFIPLTNSNNNNNSLNLTGNPVPPRLLQSDVVGVVKQLHLELLHRREICARVIQRHYRAWKKQYRFRNVVMALMEKRDLEKSLSYASKSAEMHRAAVTIQRWYRSRRCRKIWYMLVSKVLLLLSTGSGKRSIGGMTSGGRFGSIFGFDEPDHDGNIIYYTPDAGTIGSLPIIKYATIAKLVEHLTYTTYTEAAFPKIFFATYSSFLSPTELFQLLCVRYHVEPPIHASATELAMFRKTVKPRIQEKVIEMMGYWIKNHLNDFEETSARRLIAIFNETKKKNRDDMEELIKFASNAPKPILPLKPLDGAGFTLLDLSPIEVARQMALIDQTLLSRISAKELLSKKWSSQHANNLEICPNVMNMINVFNNGSKWISSEIVIEKSSKYRLKKLKFFLDVARLCYEMNNFNGVFQILYRIVLAEAKGPVIPFVGLYLMDLTFMDEGNPSFNNTLLNFVKKRLEASSVNKFLTYKLAPYCFEPVSFIQDILLNSTVLSETELYEKSVAIEKRHLRKISKRQDRERQLTTSTSNSDLAELASSSNNNNNSSSSIGNNSSSSTSNPSPTKKSSKSGKHRRHRDRDSDSPRLGKKGDPANTSSPAIMTSPGKVPPLDFNISASNLSPQHITSLYHSVDNTPISSPRFTPSIITSPTTPDKLSISNFNPIMAFSNYAFSLSPRSPRSSRPSSPCESPRNSRPSSPIPPPSPKHFDQPSPFKG
ncbi:leucine-rich repeat-containing protein [Heterostelium album PN500]|uniref:Leucine-rich repeat-containing protein n=1 Tax=Heterostelium pallidum (strain ATCC 26659 / Pp 5 / PN500) TaxID=670386 RepID=D3BLD6_HETP5|nr:leucine-rich repeat-containing protein [Heterostelium album PN500]EFA77870.1 leucine-rich repeat-containing protein [Heterostelium album PN500]|eukprot:XP_020429998.1 leucine-rich repeat-containing protein [Heterostelium album PN500]